MKIVIAGNYGAGNTGDEIILEGMLEMLKNVAPSADVTVLSANPNSTEARHGINSVKQFASGIRSLAGGILRNLGRGIFSKKTKKIVRECDYFILGGGGLFGSLTFIANIIWGIQAFMAYRYKKPVIMYGQSIGELRGVLRRYIVKKLFERASFIAVRDKKSASRLLELNIQKTIHIIPDLAFRLTHRSDRKRHGRYAVVALRQMDTLPGDFKRKIAEFLDWLVLNKKYRLSFLDFDEGEDYSLHEAIISLMDTRELATHSGHIKTTAELFRIFDRADFALTMRLHSVISAIMTSTPFIAINYAEKVEDMLKDLSMKERIVNMDRLNLKATFENLPRSTDFNRLHTELMEKHLKVEKQLRNFFYSSAP